jgi:hypothetical protein
MAGMADRVNVELGAVQQTLATVTLFRASSR